MLLCSALNIYPSITLFHHFYITMSNGDWVTFSFAMAWYNSMMVFLFLSKGGKRNSFSLMLLLSWSPWCMVLLLIGVLTLHPTYLLRSKILLIVWLKTMLNGRSNEVTLGMAGLSPIWNRLGKKPIEIVADREVNMLDRLHKKRVEESSLVTEEVVVQDSPSPLESNMDSTVSTLYIEALMPPISSSIKRNVKMESDSEKRLSSFTRIYP